MHLIAGSATTYHRTIVVSWTQKHCILTRIGYHTTEGTRFGPTTGTRESGTGYHLIGDDHHHGIGIDNVATNTFIANDGTTISEVGGWDENAAREDTVAGKGIADQWISTLRIICTILIV